MSFRHLLAYGNSDQQSFRHDQVRRSFDIMSVPGTIASYYTEATAAFVLSSQIPYLIDPRTPLFQATIATPRASHLSLAEWHGERVREALEDPLIEELEPSFFSGDTLDDMVQEVISRQRRYAANGQTAQTKLDRYAALLAEALNEQGIEPPLQLAHDPELVLAPYFAVQGLDDPWFEAVRGIWSRASKLTDPSAISPVLCVDGRANARVSGVQTLESLLPLMPQALSRTCFFWITDFDERKASEQALRRLWQVVEVNARHLDLINLYGGFFSILLRRAGLGGFGNGLTYSESRAWPALASTGAAPPRYYVPELHMFLPLATAESLVEAVPTFECPCDACSEWRDTGGTIASLPYHELKRHFALARSWEIDLAATESTPDLAARLRRARQLAEGARTSIVLRSIPSPEYLESWAKVLEDH